MSDDLHIAYESERGVQATCPTTGDTYITSRARYSTFNGKRVVNCLCRHCDSMRRTRTDPQFDPARPQVHMYFLSEVRHATEGA